MLEEPFFSDKYASFYMEKCNLECVLVRSQVTSRNIAVRYESRKHLNEGELINDEIMEFFMNDIHEKFIRKDEKTKIVINDSYFFTRLLRDIEIDVDGSLSIDSRTNLDRNIHGIVKWKRIKEEDRIFEQDLVMIPICNHGHWFVAVIKNPMSCLRIMIKSELSQESDPKEPCQIFLYDSFIEEENCLRRTGFGDDSNL
uniref:ULP_PROTEASE domain-containing protein n=1 Tax=Rhabditophanes sp. KR3021 TaxID=114890 RepID=A0AC35UG79_9BILA